MRKAIFQEAISAIEKGIPFTLGIISGVKGSTPQKQGAKALFFADGSIIGTLGGGCLEAEIRKRAIEAMRTREPAQFDLVLDHDFGWEDGLICGGKVSCVLLPNPAAALPIFRELAPRHRTRTWGVNAEFDIIFCDENAPGLLYRETVAPPEQLWIAGAGHVARAVAPLAELVDFEVTVFDDRPALADAKYFPPATKLRVEYWDTLLAENLPPVPTLGLILTRGHQHDALVLSKWVGWSFGNGQLFESAYN